ncbi:MAG: response regulator [Pseudomonadota bacterium]
MENHDIPPRDRPATLLVVDDEEYNRDIIGEFLRDKDYTLEYAADGQEAWDMLDAWPADYDAVLLDRMMPRLDGIELLRRIKADPRLAAIPVILQTAATAPQEVSEGLRLGAYYYLAKPFPREALEAVVATALADSHNQRRMRGALARTQRVLHLLREARFAFRDLGEARGLAAELASRAAAPDSVVIGLTELMINAVEHGNLGIDYAAKSALLGEGRWEDEVTRRLADPAYAGRRVTVSCVFADGLATLTIRDEGGGFDWQEYLELRPSRAFDLHGRGIALARQLSFDSLEYLGNGNAVRVTFPVA